jgi:cytoskeletal protein RodZ
VNQLNPEQAERLKEIGAYLRQVRQEQSISTEEVATKTFIPLRLLKALEEGQSEQLPEPVFIQGFIRRYADVLNLDGVALAKTFPLNLLPTKSEVSSQDFTKFLYRLIPNYLPYILYILLVGTAASGLFYLLNKPQTPKTNLQRKNSSITQEQTVTKPTSSTSEPTKAFGPSLPIQVRVSLKEKSQLRVTVDGKTEFDEVLAKGSEKTWTATKQLTLKADNASAVLIYFNQREPKLLGESRGSKEITFTPDQ